MKVAVIGAGFVGVVTGACLAEKGHTVVCVDVDPDKVDMINNAQPPIYEAGLESLLKGNAGDRLRASTDLRSAVLESDISMIAVGTPNEGSAIDLRFIEEVSREVGAAIADHSGYPTVVVKSTVVPGTTDDVVLPILEDASGKRAGPDFRLGMNPEFLRQGSAVADFMDPDRIVLGGIDDRSVETMADLYAVFEGTDVVRTTPRTAEMIKYAANSLLATMISYSNEIANLCAAIGDVDAIEVLEGVRLDRRMTPIQFDGVRVVPGLMDYLYPGCGFGGSCFPKDVQALISFGEKAGPGMPLLDAVIGINDRQPGQVVSLLETHLGALDGSQITVLGLAFKPGTDDMRESPAIPIIRNLVAQGAIVRAHDPVARVTAERVLSAEGIDYADDVASAVAGAEAVVVLTPWADYDDLPQLIAAMPAQPLVVDGRRAFEKSDFARYAGIGL